MDFLGGGRLLVTITTILLVAVTLIVLVTIATFRQKTVERKTAFRGIPSSQESRLPQPPSPFYPRYDEMYRLYYRLPIQYNKVMIRGIKGDDSKRNYRTLIGFHLISFIQNPEIGFVTVHRILWDCEGNQRRTWFIAKNVTKFKSRISFIVIPV